MSKREKNDKKTLDFLTEKSITPTPENYKIFYHYFSNSPKNIAKKVHSYIDSSPSFSQKSLNSLYKETFMSIPIDERLESVDKIIGKINKELAAIFDAVHSADSLTDTLHDQLKKYSEIIKKEHTKEAIKTVISHLLSDIEDIRNSKHVITQELDEALLQIKRLSKDFKIAKKESMYDSLTGMYNRSVFERRLKEEISRYKRYHSNFCIAFIDVDNFKTINDRFSHSIGDKVLKSVASDIEKNTRRSDIAARYGGDEFAILFSNTDLPGALSAAEKICIAIRETPVKIKKIAVTTTVSIGVALMKEGFTNEQLIDKADRAMYAIKKSSKNSIHSDPVVCKQGKTV